MSNPNTIQQPTAEELQTHWQTKHARGGKVISIATDQKYAVVAIKLAPGVTQPDDYVALKAALLAVPGIQDVELLVDGHTVATVPDGKELQLGTTVKVKQITTPTPIEPE